MHILELGTQLGVGGITRHMIELTGWLRNHGHRVTLGGSPDSWVNKELDPTFQDFGFRYVSSDGGSLPRRLAYTARSVLRVRAWLRANRPDLIHAHESAPALVANLARTGLGIPMVLTYHGSEPHRVAAFGRIAARADLVITPSHKSGEDLVKIGGVPREKLRVIGLGVAPAPVVTAVAVAALRHKLLAGGDRVILTLARLHYQKGIDILIEVAALLQPAHPGWRFIVAGHGPDEEKLRALAASRGVADMVQFIGRTAEPHLHLCAADVFLLTSRWEALPFSIAEAFRAGTPAVATACSGVVELIDSTVGAVVPVGDVPAIAAALERVLGDEAGRATLAAAALKRGVEDRFNPDWIHPQFEAAYAALIAARRQ